MSQRLIPVRPRFVGLLVVAVLTAAATGWSPPVEIYDGNYSEPSLAVDAHGFAHVVARGDTGIWYLTNKSGAWTRASALMMDHTQSGIHYRAIAPLITIDRSVGKLVVVYETVATSTEGCYPGVEYITRTGTDWSDPVPHPHQPEQPAVDRRTRRRHRDRRSRPRAAVWTEDPVPSRPDKADGWALHRVAGGGDYYSHIGAPSLALDSAGRPRIVFQRKDHVKYATGATASGVFTIETAAKVKTFVGPSLGFTRMTSAMTSCGPR